MLSFFLSFAFLSCRRFSPRCCCCSAAAFIISFSLISFAFIDTLILMLMPLFIDCFTTPLPPLLLRFIIFFGCRCCRRFAAAAHYVAASAAIRFSPHATPLISPLLSLFDYAFFSFSPYFLSRFLFFFIRCFSLLSPCHAALLMLLLMIFF